MAKMSFEERKQLKIKQKKLNKERIKHHKEVEQLAKEQAKFEKKYDGDAFISLQHINKIYPNHVQAVYDFNLEIKPKEFIVFVGPSGCGKSTTLRMIAGLEEITSGDLFINNEYSNELPPKDRNVTMVFQSYALYPHLTVYENMAFALRIQHFNKEEIDERVHKAAKILQIEEYLDRKPSALSGGQCQRVALGRAIVTDARIFLMDEPLSNLDAKLRVAMRSEIVKLHNSLDATTIYVTHDQTEAMTMASRIVVMNKGVVQQIDTPEQIFNHPSNLFVATFIGSPAMNILEVASEKNIILLENNHSLNMGKDFDKKVKEFYLKELKQTEKEIEDWKEEFVHRENMTRKYQKVFSKDNIDILQVIKYLEQFGNENITGSIANEVDNERIRNIVNNFLREKLYELESLDNPLIIELNKKHDELKKGYESNARKLLLGIRPEHVVKDNLKGAMDLKVNLVELLGSEYYLHLDFADKEILAKLDVEDKVKEGDTLKMAFKASMMHIFDPITSKRIDLEEEYR